MDDERMIEQNRIFLLSRKWKFPTIMASVFFVIINVIMIHDHLINENPICNASLYSDWIYEMIVYEGISFNVMIIMQLSHVILWSPQHVDVGCQIICCFIFVFAGASSFIDSRKSLIGICEDSFGVRLPASILSEWIVCVPLMYYIVLSTDQKQTLSQNDFLMLSFTSVVYLSCFGLQVVNFQPLSLFFLITAFVAFFVSSYLLYYATVVKNNDNRIQALSESELTSPYTRCVKKSQKKIAMIILSIFPFFPIVYLLSLFRVINHDIAYLLIIILNVISKIVFVNIVINTNANINIEIIRIQLMSQSMALSQETAANESRRQFVRYIMHEVRVPLNSITMGIGYLEQCSGLDDDAQEALIMMNGATGFMKQTLNDVLNMQRIEDGKMELEYAPFSIDKMIQRVRASVQGIVREKQISLVLSIRNNVPQNVIGDGFRVEHVIVNLLSNALKFSPPHSEVLIEVKCGADADRRDVISKLGVFNTGHLRTSFNFQNQASSAPSQSRQNKSLFSESTTRASVTFSVTDQGPGMSESDLQTLFLPFSQIRPHELQSGGGSGIGLVICKQIVELHGGTITCTSEVGVGSTFSFSIPFETGFHSQRIKEVSGRAEGVESESEYKKQQQQDKYRTVSTFIDNQLENVIFSDKFTYDELTPDPTTDPDPDSLLSSSGRNNLLRGLARCNSPSVSQHPHIHPHPTTDSKAATQGDTDNNNIKSSSASSPLLKHALLVDDVTSNRKLLAMLLKKRGILSSMASNGQLALETVRGSGGSAVAFDLVFMDNSMPVMSGVEATRRLRAMGFGNLIIGITGNAMEDDVAAFVAAGADSVILKPVSVQQINQLVTYLQVYGNSHVEGRRISFYDTHYLTTDTN